MTVYVMGAMESGVHVWAKAPGFNPGHSAHFSGGRSSGKWVGLQSLAGIYCHRLQWSWMVVG
eukprot:11469812-Ditylum_brightwellii.AAC.1